MKQIKDWVRDFKSGRISRRAFVERAATGGLSLLATTSILGAKAHAEGRGGEINHQHNHGHGHHHHHGAQRSPSRQRTWNQTNVNPWEEWLQQENLPVHKDYYISDLRKTDVKPAKRISSVAARIRFITRTQRRPRASKRVASTLGTAALCRTRASWL